MVPYDLAVQNGTVVNEHGAARLDVYVRAGKIAVLAEPTEQWPARSVVDATGLHVLPGIIDAHTHFRTFTKHSDAFADMSRSAAYGGVTTVIAFIMGMNATELRPRERVAHFLEETSAGAPTDFAFHAAIADEPGTLEDIPVLAQMGVNSFKMFMAYRARRMMVDDGFMWRAMHTIQAAGGTVMVHAEAGDVCDALEVELQAAPNGRDAGSVAASRPPWVEAEATRRALALAEKAGCAVYFVHVSTDEAMGVIRLARARGQHIFAETCPQYLNLTVEDFARLGGLAKIAPPLRSESDQAALLRTTLRGEINVIGSDHAPYTVADKQGDLWAAPFGAPGTETLLAMTYRALAAAGGDVCALARLLAAEPARIFGLYPRKGLIAVGSDADLTLVDFAAETVVDGSAQHNTSGYSPYDGLATPLRVVGSFLRGQPLLRDGALVATQLGRFLPRGAPEGQQAGAGSTMGREGNGP
jgi:dihydropyrimidinase